MGPEQQLRRQVLLLGVAVEGGLALLAWLIAWLLGRSPLGAGFAWSLEGVAWGVAACAPMVAGVLVVYHFPVGPFASLRRLLDDFVPLLFRHCTLAELALICVLAGVGEEMLFRGVLQGALGDWLGPWVGLLLASVLFGLMHPISPLYVVLATLLGVYLGLVWMFTGNLLVVILAHALYDFVLLVYLLRGPLAARPAAPAPSATETEGAGQPSC